MMTVREVAEHYGVSAAFMLRALDKIGFRNAEPDTALATPTITRFEAMFGDKIRVARPKAETPTPVRTPTPHVMRVAHAKVTAGRDAQGQREKQLLADPGPVHAIDVAGTRDGDPWNGKVVPGAVFFYDGSVNSGPSAACGFVHMRAVLGDEFVPSVDAGRTRQCPRCAEVVAEGRGFREPPNPFGYHRSNFCEAYLRVKVDGAVKVKDCSLPDRHRGSPHRAHDGSEWEVGVDDYVPTSDEVGRRITEAS